MTWSLQTVFFVSCICCHAAGQYTLTGSDSYAEVGSTFTFTCTTSPAPFAVAWSETTSPSAGGSTYFYTYFYNTAQRRCQYSSGAPPANYSFNCTSTVFSVTFPVNYTRHSGSLWKCADPGGSERSNTITLSVRVPLRSVTLLNSTSSPLTVRQGTEVTLVCETNPTDPVSNITWRRDGQMVSQGVTSSTRSETEGTVTISVWSKTVQWSDRGGYRCEAQNNGINRSSQTLTVAVQVPVSAVTLTNITSNNQQVPVNEDSSLSLTCQTSPAYPALTVTWYIRGTMTSSGVVSRTETQTSGQIITVSTLSRTMSKDNDGDWIYCKAENGYTVKQSYTARANVYYGPDSCTVNMTKPVAIAERNQVTLTCRTLTSVNPEVDFSWSYGDNIPITIGQVSKQGSARNTWSHTLTLTALRDSNKQVVRCAVSNTQTSRSGQSQLDLDVNYGPDTGEVDITKSSTAVEHELVILTCRTTNNVKPDVNFNWTVDGSDITSSTGNKHGSSGSMWSQTLTLSPTRNQRSVGCTVTNSLIARQDSDSVELDVNSMIMLQCLLSMMIPPPSVFRLHKEHRTQS